MSRIRLAGTADAAARLPGPLALLWPKPLLGRRRAAAGGTIARAAVLGTVALLFWAMLFGIVYRVLAYFRGAEGIGEILAVKLLGLVLLMLLSVLLLSNLITALSSFFLARDLELLMAAPVDGLWVYLSRLFETIVHSSWMVVLVLVPVLTAYAIAYDAGWDYVAVAGLALAGYLTLPAVVGSMVTLVLVNVFPARRARDLLALIALFGAAGVIVMIRLVRPEQLARPEGFRNLVDFMATLQTPQSVWLPSEWAAQAILAPLRAGGGLFPLLLLLSTAAASVVLGAWLHLRLYAEGFSRAQEGAELREEAGGRRRDAIERLLRPAPLTTRTLVVKDVRTFFRDTTQWSQLILLGVLVVVYVYNIKVLPLWQGEEVGFFLVNLVSFLNLALAGFVLAAIAARFLFPAISLEGRTLWLLRSAPLDLRALVWSKFWVGVAPLLLLSLSLTVATNLILRVEPFMMALSLVTITVMTLAIASLALGLGALFPNFGAENAAQIPTSFGGLVFMMSAVAYLGLVVALEARPVYLILRARAQGVPLDASHWVGLGVGLGLALAVSIVVIVAPMRLAVRRIGELEG